MATNQKLNRILNAIMQVKAPAMEKPTGVTNAAGVAMPQFDEVDIQPKKVPMTKVQHPDGRMS